MSKSNYSRRQFLKISAIGSMGLFASLNTGFSFAQDSMMAEQSDISFASFNINWATNIFPELADHFGWLEEEGITSQEMSVVDSTQIFPAMLGGSLNFAQHDTDAIAGANLAGAPIKFIATYRNREPWMFAVAAEIETIEDLYGKTVSAGGAGGRSEWNSKAMIERLGGDPEQIIWQPIGGGSDARVQAFMEGQIVGVNLFDRHRPLIEEVNGRLVYDELEAVPQDAFCAPQSFIEENERTVIGWLKATTKARQYFFDIDNKDEIIDILIERGYEFPSEFVEIYDRQLETISQTGHFNVEAMEKLIADSVLTGSLEEPIDWRDFTEMRLLNTAFEELGLDPVDYEAGGEMDEDMIEPEATEEAGD